MADDPFLVAIDQWIASTRDRTDRVLRAVAEDSLARIKELTPVDTGTLRANWAVISGRQSQSLAGIRAEDSLAVILQLHAGDYWTLINPTIYAARVNFGFVGEDSLGRHYDQKGRHMLEQTITEMPQIVAAAVARVASGRGR